MYEYSTIRKFYKAWAKYKKVKLSKDDITILCFYAQEHYKIQNRRNPLFEKYVKTKVKEFDWNDIDEETAQLLVEVWNTYIHIIEKKMIQHFVSNENNYRDIHKLIKGQD